MKKVVVIGGGASGMLAAIIASRQGADTLLLEKNEKLGKKLYITGKGRCNITNACDRDTFFDNVVRNPKFMYSSYSAFDNAGIVRLLESGGLKMKKERGNRVFPVSDHASDVTATLRKLLDSNKVKIRFNSEVKKIITSINDSSEGESRACGVKLAGGETIDCDRVIVCTGGLSYPTTGSTGFGIEEAKRLGLDCTDTSPSLVPFNVREDVYASEMQGLALKNVSVKITDSKNKLLYNEFGEMLFTHYGVSGPLMLSASAVVGEEIKKKRLSLRIDLKPALDTETIDKRLVKVFEKNKNKAYKNTLTEVLPKSMIGPFVSISGIDPDKKVNEITKTERDGIVVLLKQFPLTLTSLRDFDEAIITRGGVSIKEIDPKTMESKKIKGLYFAGEVLDVDALTGGFNLQIAWSTGYCAGLHAAEDQ